MGSYITNFIVYTLAMSGLIYLAVFIYKKVMSGSLYSKKSASLEIEETMNITPRKSLMIIRAGEERFLVASDFDRTSLISKLGENEGLSGYVQPQETFVQDNFQTPEIENTNTNYAEPSAQKDEPVHLELIKGTRKKSPRKRRVTSTKDSGINMKTKSRIDTMRKMAKKINEI